MSVALALPKHLTPAEYLDSERKSETKNEFVNGLIRAMSGASRPHNRVNENLSIQIGVRLIGSLYESYSRDMRVKVSASGNYRYPGLIVVCGEPEFEDRHFDTLLNPILVVEILSKSTEEIDREEKFADYKTIPGFCEYILVSQTEVYIEQYVKDVDGNWPLRIYTKADTSVFLPAIGCEVAIADIYYRVPNLNPFAAPPRHGAGRNGDS